MLDIPGSNSSPAHQAKAQYLGSTVAIDICLMLSLSPDLLVAVFVERGSLETSTTSYETRDASKSVSLRATLPEAEI